MIQNTRTQGMNKIYSLEIERKDTNYEIKSHDNYELAVSFSGFHSEFPGLFFVCRKFTLNLHPI